MKRATPIRRRPSLELVVACAALFIVLGGVGYAVTANGVPDGNGVFHGCVDRPTGALRIVPSSTQCRAATPGNPNSGEKAVLWSQRGRAGASAKNGLNGPPIIARLRAGTVTATTTVQPIPLTPSSWRQAPNADNTLLTQLTVQSPSPQDCNVKSGTTTSPASARIAFSMDGVLLNPLNVTTTGDTRTLRLGTFSSIAGGSPFTHTVDLSLVDSCGNGGGAANAHFKVLGVAFDVLSVQ
jgi:hypothetical protein